MATNVAPVVNGQGTDFREFTADKRGKTNDSLGKEDFFAAHV